MKIDRALKLERRFFKERQEVRKSKGHDYAVDNDCLSNFKLMSKLCKLFEVDVTVPYGNAFYMILHKLVRTSQFVFGERKGTDPYNESLYDTIVIDCPNYHDLFVELLIDEGVLNVDEPPVKLPTLNILDYSQTIGDMTPAEYICKICNSLKETTEFSVYQSCICPDCSSSDIR